MTERLDIVECSHCGEEHKSVLVHLLREPVSINGEEFTHWAACPNDKAGIVYVKYH